MKVLTVLRVLPFAALALASIWAANRAPDGRRPPQIDFTVTLEAIANALTNTPHIASMAMLFALAVLATGYSRVWLAAVLTFLVGVSWELVQTTVIATIPVLLTSSPTLLALPLPGSSYPCRFSSVAQPVRAWRRTPESCYVT
ncbi:hypothetical protein [Mesorhizobium denitrificans]|uniref:hypothetical protein n=1 Tax=Mesorhizobium denitrificans TaxID=2294114 RepID=UPI0018F503AC|nr:hypothetical protein [Mesorhizobium denitrificans]